MKKKQKVQPYVPIRSSRSSSYFFSGFFFSRCYFIILSKIQKLEKNQNNNKETKKFNPMYPLGLW